VLVLPRVHPVELPPDVAAEAGEESAGARAVREPAFDLEGIGPYQPSTPMSRIHWAGLARHDILLERRFMPESDGVPLVVLDGRADAEASFDEAVRATASLVRHLASRRGVAVLLPGAEHPVEVGSDLRAWPALHVDLALVEPDGRAPAVHPHTPARAVFWVTADAGAAAPTVLAARSAATPCFLVGPGHRPGAPAFAVGSCRGWRLAGGERRAA
jgi:uncharacterized protein (DUF58 family)